MVPLPILFHSFLVSLSNILWASFIQSSFILVNVQLPLYTHSCCYSVAKSCLTLCNPMGWSMQGFPVLHCFPELAQTYVHWVNDAIQPSHPLSSPSPPPFNVSQCQSSLCIRWPKYWSFSFGISPSNEHSGLISFRMDWLDLFSVQGPLKSLSQHHSSKSSILWLSAFFMSNSHLQTWLLEKP